MAIIFNRTLPVIAVPRSWEETDGMVASLQEWFNKLNGTLSSLVNEVNGFGGRTVHFFDSYASVPTLTLADAGTLVFVTDYNHLMRWTGSLWVFADGGNAFIAHFATAPPASAGWTLCNGTSQGYLVGGASLSVTLVTLPDLAGSPAYLKAAAAYTGSIVAAAGASGGQSADHTHTFSATTGVANDGWAGDFNNDGVLRSFANLTHGHAVSGTTSGTSGDHTHGAGTLEPAHLNMLPYFRQ